MIRWLPALAAAFLAAQRRRFAWTQVMTARRDTLQIRGRAF